MQSHDILLLVGRNFMEMILGERLPLPFSV